MAPAEKCHCTICQQARSTGPYKATRCPKCIFFACAGCYDRWVGSTEDPVIGCPHCHQCVYHIQHRAWMLPNSTSVNEGHQMFNIFSSVDIPLRVELGKVVFWLEVLLVILCLIALIHLLGLLYDLGVTVVLQAVGFMGGGLFVVGFLCELYSRLQ